MSVLGNVLIEEQQRLKRDISIYEEMLNDLPRGSIFIRKMGSSSYAYRKYKEKGKLISVYLGNIKEEKVKREIELSNDYKRIKNNISVAKKELNKLNKAIKLFQNEY